jgi:hypothetical protein
MKAARLFTTSAATKRLTSSFRNPAAITGRLISTAACGGGTETYRITDMARVMSVLLNVVKKMAESKRSCGAETFSRGAQR